jgi:hypothetical protein
MSQFNNPSNEWVLENIFLPGVVKEITSNDTPVILVIHHLPVPVGRKNLMSEEMVEIKVFFNETQMNTYIDITENDGSNKGLSIEQGVHYVNHHRLFDESPEVIFEWFVHNSKRITNTTFRVDIRTVG